MPLSGVVICDSVLLFFGVVTLSLMRKEDSGNFVPHSSPQHTPRSRLATYQIVLEMELKSLTSEILEYLSAEQ